MQKGLIFFAVNIFLSFTLECYGCICGDSRLLEENIKLYAFIAHVKIIGKTIHNDTVMEGDKTRVRFGHEADLVFEIIEMFKGDSLKGIKEDGVKTSCEIGIQEGEEWIIFAWYNPQTKAYSVGACSPSRRIKNRDNERGADWEWNLNGGTLAYLKKYFGHPPSEPRYECGIYRNYYPNGNVEWEAEYADNKLHGHRKIYFANGILWEDENYKDGKKSGVQKRYTRSGQLISESDYSEGEVIHSISWYDTSYEERGMRAFAQRLTSQANIDSFMAATPAVIQKQSENFDDRKRGVYHSPGYDEKGALVSENFIYNSGAVRLNCRYRENRLESEGIYTKNDDHTIEKTWNEKGELISMKEWINGKYTGDKIKKQVPANK